jgi:hypothetical protein
MSSASTGSDISSRLWRRAGWQIAIPLTGRKEDKRLDRVDSSPPVPTGQVLGALRRRWMRMSRQAVINQERSHRTRFTIDNNADNNPWRHR